MTGAQVLGRARAIRLGDDGKVAAAVVPCDSFGWQTYRWGTPHGIGTWLPVGWAASLEVAIGRMGA